MHSFILNFRSFMHKVKFLGKYVNHFFFMILPQIYKSIFLRVKLPDKVMFDYVIKNDMILLWAFIYTDDMKQGCK